MIKFKAEGNTGPLYGFGLSRGNLDKLTAGQPISFNLAAMGGPQLQIVILFGETEEAIVAELKAGGLIGAEFGPGPARPGETDVYRDQRPRPEDEP